MGASCYPSTPYWGVYHRKVQWEDNATHPPAILSTCTGYIAESCKERTMVPIHPPYWCQHQRKIQWDHHVTHPPTEVCFVERYNGRILLPIHPTYDIDLSVASCAPIISFYDIYLSMVGGSVAWCSNLIFVRCRPQFVWWMGTYRDNPSIISCALLGPIYIY